MKLLKLILLLFRSTKSKLLRFLTASLLLFIPLKYYQYIKKVYNIFKLLYQYVKHFLSFNGILIMLNLIDFSNLNSITNIYYLGKALFNFSNDLLLEFIDKVFHTNYSINVPSKVRIVDKKLIDKVNKIENINDAKDEYFSLRETYKNVEDSDANSYNWYVIVGVSIIIIGGSALLYFNWDSVSGYLHNLYDHLPKRPGGDGPNIQTPQSPQSPDITINDIRTNISPASSTGSITPKANVSNTPDFTHFPGKDVGLNTAREAERAFGSFFK